MQLSIGIILGLAAMFFFGSGKITTKKLVDSVGEYSAVLYSNSMLVAFLLIWGGLFTSFELPSARLLYIIAALGFVGAVSMFLFMKAIKIGKIAIVVPITSGFGIVTVILAMIILKESLSFAAIAGILLVITGTIIISFRYSELKKIKAKAVLSGGMGFSLLVAIGWGVYYFFIRFVSVELGGVLSAIYVESAVLFFIFLLALSNMNKIRKPHGRDYLYILITGLFIAAASIAYYTGVSVSKVSVVAAITSAAPLVSSLLAVILLKERIELNQKIATLMIVAGLVILSV